MRTNRYEKLETNKRRVQKKNKGKGGPFMKMVVNFYDKKIRKLIGTQILFLDVKIKV